MKITKKKTMKSVKKFTILLLVLMSFILMTSCIGDALGLDNQIVDYNKKYLIISLDGELSTIYYEEIDNSKDYIEVKGDFVIPSTVYGINVTSIGEDAFSDCNKLTSITIPDSVTSIGDHAFCYCSSLTSITIPDSVISIGDQAFDDCSKLASIRIGESNPNYSADGPILYNKNRTRLLAYPSAKGIISIPSTVTSIGDYAFKDCSSLTSITIPDSVTYIGWYAFYGCSSLTSITITDSVISIGLYAFDNCGALNVIFKEGVTHIPNILNSSYIVSVSIPSSVTSIGDYAFSGCSKLASITIPNSVTSIGHYAFSGSILSNIVYSGTTAQWNQISKSYDWASGCATSVVVCSDGNVSIYL